MMWTLWLPSLKRPGNKIRNLISSLCIWRFETCQAGFTNALKNARFVPTTCVWEIKPTINKPFFMIKVFKNIYLNFFLNNLKIVEIQLPWFPASEKRTNGHSILKWIFHVETCLAVTLTALKITTKGLFTLSPVSGHYWPTAYFPAKNQFLHGNSYIKWHIIFHVSWNEIHAIIELFSKL